MARSGVFCMSARPGRIIAEREIGFARPRDLDLTYTPDFAAVVQELRGNLPRGEGRGWTCMDNVCAETPRRGSKLGRGLAAQPDGLAVMSRSAWLKLAPYLFTIGLFLIWEAACRASRSRPSCCRRPRLSGSASCSTRAALHQSLPHAVDATAGFGLAILFGLALGLLVGSSRLIYAGLIPLIVGFNSIPKVAEVPILVIWFGVGWLPPVLTAFVISFFPIVVNVATASPPSSPKPRMC